MSIKQNYRFITGPDDAQFCQRVSDALADGYVLYGHPQHTYNAEQKIMVCGQAVVLPHYK